MHIPDGFIAPQCYLPAYAVCGGLWMLAARRARTGLAEEVIPRLAVMTALAFVLTTVMIPIPGGTSVHASGIALLALLFGVWQAFISMSLVLLLQALLLGAGGITSLPVNALAMGLAGPAAAVGTYRMLRSLREELAVGVAGWTGVVASGGVLAVVLGLQPRLAHTPDGEPLFFPFGLVVTLPAVGFPAALVGVGEGVLTVLVWRYARRRGWLELRE
ncbi:energy-coupling factor ABC transporter permease [Thiohalorhabdus sp. Cl-TMA]|uniref:Energy-coupling factor ABC transporter permease n=1 Tax=Thiohalorhabdus methylotrophus TaxID=3242694 RepID=A0ABV4TW67_9GAMM